MERTNQWCRPSYLGRNAVAFCETRNMRKIKVKRLPVITTATVMAIYRAIVMFASWGWQKTYLRALFGREAKLAADSASTHHAAFALCAWAFPVVLTWLTAVLVIVGFNALAKSTSLGITVHVE